MTWASEGSGRADGESNWSERLSIALHEPISSLSLSPSNRDVVLGARKGLYIVDLANPWDRPRLVSYPQRSAPVDVQWSVHPIRSHWIVSTSGSECLLWNVDATGTDDGRSPIEQVLIGHERSITDINWAVFDTETLATASLDGWIRIWDLRTSGRRSAAAFSGWHVGCTSVKWNRQDAHTFASAHDTRVLIWDTRKGSSPVQTIEAHRSRIYGIDWSRRVADELVTCALDRTVKHWHLPTSTAKSFETITPTRRARFTPFGRGFMTLPCRGDNTVTMRSDDGAVLSTFAGHADTPLEFVWRTRGGQEPSVDDREFQLVTWGKDRTLRLWPVAQSMLQTTGHIRGSPIDVRMTRRNFTDVSYRTIQSPATSPNVPRAMAMRLPQGTPTPSGSRLPGRPFDVLSSSAPTTSGFGAAFPFRHGSPASEQQTSHSHDTPAALPITAPATARTTVPAASPFPQTGFMTRGTIQTRKMQQVDPLIWLDGVKRFDEPAQALDADAAPHRLGEELAACGRKFGARLTFEHVGVSQRELTVTGHGPWSDRHMLVFLRVRFVFPRNYPRGEPPIIKAERSPDMPVRQRTRLLKGLRDLVGSRAAAGQASLDECLSFIVGEPAVVEQVVASSSSSSSSEDEDETKLQHVPILPPRRACVSFGPHDELVIVRPTVRRAPRRTSSPHRVMGTSTASVAATEQRRVFESFGVLPRSPAANEPASSDDDHTESDVALRVSSVAIGSRRGLHDSTLVGSRTLEPASRAVHIVRDPTLTPLAAVARDALQAMDASGAAGVICRQFAKSSSDPLIARLWLSLASVLPSCPAVRLPLENVLAQGIVLDVISVFRQRRDLVGLGIVATVLELHQRESSGRLRPTPKTIEDAPRPPLQRLPSSVLLSPSLPRTPALSTPPMPGSAGKTPASWSGISLWPTFSFSTPPTPASSARGSQPPDSPMRAVRQASFGSTPEVDEKALLPDSPDSQQAPSRATGVTAVPQRMRSSAPPQLNKRHSSKAKQSVTFGPARVIDPGTPVLEHEASQRLAKTVVVHRAPSTAASPLVPDALQPELERVRRAFAELLHRWGLVDQRIAVLKLCRDVASESGLGVPATIGAPADGAVPETRRLICDVCRRPAPNMASVCTRCLHGGHLDCLAVWQAESRACPAGCACLCVRPVHS